MTDPIFKRPIGYYWIRQLDGDGEPEVAHWYWYELHDGTPHGAWVCCGLDYDVRDEAVDVLGGPIEAPRPESP